MVAYMGGGACKDVALMDMLLGLLLHSIGVGTRRPLDVLMMNASKQASLLGMDWTGLDFGLVWLVHSWGRLIGVRGDWELGSLRVWMDKGIGI